MAMSPFLPRSVRTIGRLQSVAMVLTRHGFGHLVDSLNLRRHIPFAQRLGIGPPAAADGEGLRALGRRIAAVCEDLGPTYVKLAQMASTRPDVVPPDIVSALQKLQDHVAPFDTADARRIIEDDLGASVEASFRKFADEPFASGSIAQVYHADTTDGRQVVVKVKRPGIDESIQLDMHILEWLAKQLEAHVPDLAVHRPTLIVDEFQRTVTRELDFVNEASATARFEEAFRDDPTVLVPEVRWDLTGPRVLTLTRLTGVPVQRIIDRPDDAIDNRLVAKHLADAFMRQYFNLGMFHGDPHPGNLLISPPGRIGLIDFGMVGQVDDELGGHLVVCLLATVNKEVDLIVDALADLGALGPRTDQRQLSRSLRELVDKYHGLPLRRIDLQTLFHEITELFRRHDITLPRDFILLGKSLVTVAGVALQLDPELNLVEHIRPRIRDMLKDRLSVSRLARSVGIRFPYAFFCVILLAGVFLQMIICRRFKMRTGFATHEG